MGQAHRAQCLFQAGTLGTISNNHRCGERGEPRGRQDKQCSLRAVPICCTRGPRPHEISEKSHCQGETQIPIPSEAHGWGFCTFARGSQNSALPSPQAKCPEHDPFLSLESPRKTQGRVGAPQGRGLPGLGPKGKSDPPTQGEAKQPGRWDRACWGDGEWLTQLRV